MDNRPLKQPYIVDIVIPYICFRAAAVAVQHSSGLGMRCCWFSIAESSSYVIIRLLTNRSICDHFCLLISSARVRSNGVSSYHYVPVLHTVYRTIWIRPCLSNWSTTNCRYYYYLVDYFHYCCLGDFRLRPDSPNKKPYFYRVMKLAIRMRCPIDGRHRSCSPN